jgi:hypothetical protein
MRVAMFNGAGRPITIEHTPDPEPGPEDMVLGAGTMALAHDTYGALESIVLP